MRKENSVRKENSNFLAKRANIMKIFILFFTLLVLELIYTVNSKCILSEIADTTLNPISIIFIPPMMIPVGGAGGIGK